MVTEGYSATYGARLLRRAVRQQGQNGPCVQGCAREEKIFCAREEKIFCAREEEIFCAREEEIFCARVEKIFCAREEERPRRLDAEEWPLQRSGACPMSPTSPPMSLQVQRLIEDPVAEAVRDTACNHACNPMQLDVEMRSGAGIEDDWNAAASCPSTRSPARWRGEPGREWGGRGSAAAHQTLKPYQLHRLLCRTVLVL